MGDEGTRGGRPEKKSEVWQGQEMCKGRQVTDRRRAAKWRGMRERKRLSVKGEQRQNPRRRVSEIQKRNTCIRLIYSPQVGHREE